MMSSFCKFFYATLLLALLTPQLVSAEEVFVLKTSDIIPYNTCIEGLRETLSAHSLQVLNMEGDIDKGKEIIASLQGKKPKLLIAVGPQAAFLLSELNYPFPKLFCMVLNPQKLLGQEKLYPGVSINIPPVFQLQEIKKTFPSRSKVGVVYSEQSNKIFVETLTKDASRLGLSLVPFLIASASDILPGITSKEFSPEVLLMIPDELINSQKIVEYIIKESVRRTIPVVGYNSWFAKNGAILSFIIDYRDIGVQAAGMGIKILKEGRNTGTTVETPARIRISIDLKTAQKLGIQISPKVIQQAEEVIR
jgi:putative ABC transport system substrate-binding protein